MTPEEPAFDLSRPFVGHALIRYTDAEGEARVYGDGINGPTVSGSTPRAVALTALALAPRFVQQHYSSVSSVARYTDTPFLALDKQYSPTFTFARDELDPLLAGVRREGPRRSRNTPSM